MRSCTACLLLLSVCVAPSTATSVGAALRSVLDGAPHASHLRAEQSPNVDDPSTENVGTDEQPIAPGLGNTVFDSTGVGSNRVPIAGTNRHEHVTIPGEASVDQTWSSDIPEGEHSSNRCAA